MFRLDEKQIAAVAGGTPTVSEAMTVVGGIGGGIGASAVIQSAGGTIAGVTALGSTTAITVFSAAGAGLGAAYIGGTYIGGQINDNLSASTKDAIGGTIAAGIDNVESIASIVWKALRQSGFYGSQRQTGASSCTKY